MDISGTIAGIHMRTDANNLMTTASTTHLPEQKETIHMINQLRTEACSGSTHDLAHVEWLALASRVYDVAALRLSPPLSRSAVLRRLLLYGRSATSPLRNVANAMLLDMICG